MSRISSGLSQRKAARPFAVPRESSSLSRGDFIIGRRNDQLAAYFVGDRVLLAERTHLPNPAYGELGLQRPGLVVQPCVEDTAIVAALVLPNARFLLEDANSSIRYGFGQLVRDSQPDDAAADDAVLLRQKGTSSSPISMDGPGSAARCCCGRGALRGIETG